MKVISFSLWGSDPKYCVGAIRNLFASKYIYPDWKCRFYVANSVPRNIVSAIFDNGGEVVEKDSAGDWSSMFWRFEAGTDQNCDAVIFRDTDSRLNIREALAVKEWINSGKSFHIMRDHPFHGYKILGGMWGIRPRSVPKFSQILSSFVPKNEYGTDYKFFGEVLFDKIGNDKLTHDEFFEKKPFPVARCGLEFVGQVFDEKESAVPEHLKHLRSSINTR